MNNSGKLSLCVIFGGVSSEHEVSRMSATSILENLSSEKYDVHMVGITKEGKWLLYTGDVKDIYDGSWEKGPVAPAFLSPTPRSMGWWCAGAEPKPWSWTWCSGAPRQKRGGRHHSGPLPAGPDPLCGLRHPRLFGVQDKAVTHTCCPTRTSSSPLPVVLRGPVPGGGGDHQEKIKARLSSLCRQAANAGSSVGVSKVERYEDLDAAIEAAAREDSKIVVEEGIRGQEVECAVLGNRECEASLVGRSAPRPSFTTMTTST